MDDGLKKEDIEQNVDDVKEVKEKRKDFVRNECLEAKKGLGTNDNTQFVKVKEIGGEWLLEAKKIRDVSHECQFLNMQKHI